MQEDQTNKKEVMSEEMIAKAREFEKILDRILGGPGPSDEELIELQKEWGVTTGRYRLHGKRTRR